MKELLAKIIEQTNVLSQECSIMQTNTVLSSHRKALEDIRAKLVSAYTLASLFDQNL